jgi:putative flippase GtrA
MINNLQKFVNRETISYTIFGVLTSVLNIGLFEILLIAGIEYKSANLITLFIVKIVAYVVNKVFVFSSKSPSASHLLIEFIKFLLTRGGTMLVDYFGLIILVDILAIDKTFGKIATTIVVVALNYVFGKLVVFTKPSANS